MNLKHGSQECCEKLDENGCGYFIQELNDRVSSITHLLSD
jgi:hypothetical protein